MGVLESEGAEEGVVVEMPVDPDTAQDVLLAVLNFHSLNWFFLTLQNLS